jgi:anti-sigma-K factor RskA
MLTCEEISQLGGAYALGALDDDELAALEEHVEQCPSCRARLDPDLAVAAALALAPSPVEPPATLKAGLLAAARGDALAARRPPWWQRLFPSPTRAALGAASLASLAFAVALSWALSLQSALARSPAAPPAPAAAQAGSAQYVAHLNMKQLVGADAAPDARGWLYLDPGADGALLVATRLPPLAPDRSYQLWLVKDGQRVSGGVFRVDAEGYGWLKVWTPQPLGVYQRAGITVEPLDGSPGPTGARVLGGDL